MIDLALSIVIVLFMLGSLGGVGLALSPREAMAPLASASFVARVVAANWVVPPAVAWLLLAVVPLDPAYATGLWLLALAPCAPFAPALVAVALGHTPSMAAILLSSIATTVVVMPLALPLVTSGVSADVVTIAGPLVGLVLVPLVAGLMVHRVAPRAAAWLRRPLAAVSSAAGIVGLVLVGIVHGRGMLEAVGSFAIITQIVFLCAITAAAHAIGRGLDGPQRRTLTVCTCTRNLGAALAPLAAGGSDPRAIIMVAIAVPTTVAIGTAVARWFWLDARARRPLRHGG